MVRFISNVGPAMGSVLAWSVSDLFPFPSLCICPDSGLWVSVLWSSSVLGYFVCLSELIHLSLVVRAVAPFLLLGGHGGRCLGTLAPIQKGPKYLWVGHCGAPNVEKRSR